MSIPIGAVKQHIHTVPDTAVVFEGAGSLLTFQTELDSTWIVFLLQTERWGQLMYFSTQIQFSLGFNVQYSQYKVWIILDCDIFVRLSPAYQFFYKNLFNNCCYSWYSPDNQGWHSLVVKLIPCATADLNQRQAFIWSSSWAFNAEPLLCLTFEVNNEHIWCVFVEGMTVPQASR